LRHQINGRENEQHTSDIKMIFSIEIKQDYNRSTEVTTLHPSFS
jgi:hypothetical protein